jgi:hypothetical protein
VKGLPTGAHGKGKGFDCVRTNGLIILLEESVTSYPGTACERSLHTSSGPESGMWAQTSPVAGS